MSQSYTTGIMKKFAIIMNSAQESYRHLEYCTNVISVGRMFYIVEPKRLVSMLGEMLPLISSTMSLIPLKFLNDTLSMRQLFAIVT